MNVAVIKIVTGALGTVIKGLVQGLDKLEIGPSKLQHFLHRSEY